MLKRPFRDHHLLQLLDNYDQQSLPLDLFISHYFRDNKALGSKDRGEIADTIYSLIRWKGLIDYLHPNSNWDSRLDAFRALSLEDIQNNNDIPQHQRVSFPEYLFQRIVDSHGMEKAIEICLNSNQPAPATVRVNPLKVNREQLMQRWKGLFEVAPCSHSALGIIFHKKTHFFSLPEFQEGLFEVQDEGSQLLSHLMQPKPGDQVLDFCAGSGGKTLAFAYLMEGKGQIYLHDIRPHVLIEARKRLRRAGIQNNQTLLAGEPKLEKLKKKMDWILVDAPCSGTGTMRRNPDMKWKFDESMLTRLLGQQKVIFEKALSYLKPNGKIVYATCSILKEENQQQVEHFVNTYGLQICGQSFSSLPVPGGMDGFFGVVLERK